MIPATVPSDVFDYPYKFKPLEDAEKALVYRPQNLRYDYERFQWENAKESIVVQKLDRIASFVEDSFLPWAQIMPLVKARSEIEKNGEDAWCERLWIEDYTARLS